MRARSSSASPDTTPSARGSDPSPERGPLRPRGARLSGEGSSALAVFALRGRIDDATLARLFAAPPERLRRAGGLVRTRLLSSEGELDEVVVATSVDGFEFTTHGGPAVVRAAEARLRETGFEVVEAGEVAPSECGPAIRRERDRVLGTAFGEHAARFLSSAPERFELEVAGLRASLRGGRGASIRSRLESLLRRAPFGLAMAEPPLVVLFGAPNAGKSTLSNALLGEERSIVTAEEGTTRDVVSSRLVLEGWPFRLADTAGLRASDDPVEREGVARARDACATAAVRLLVIDGSRPWPAGAPELAGLRPTLVVLAKSDLAGDPETTSRASTLGRPVVAVGAPSGAGLAALATEIVRASPFHSPVPVDAPAPFTRRAQRLLGEALALLDADPNAALAVLDSLLENLP